MTSFFGTPADFKASSLVSTAVSQPGGAQRGTTPLNQPLGSALSGENYIVRDGALELRPVLSIFTDYSFSWLSKGPVGGGIEAQFLNQKRVPLALKYESFMYYNINSWSPSPNNYTLQGNHQTRWDAAQSFLTENNVIVVVPDTQQGLYYFGESSALTLESLTTIIGAKRVAVFDNYVLVGNVYEPSSGISFPQRVQWSDRGSASSWTGGLSGFEDLYAAKGELQRIIALENRIIVFFEDETWQGLPAEYPFTFRFSPLDQGVGCPFPWTATVTPQGIMFMARDYQMYLLPKAGGQSMPVGNAIQRKIRSDITWPERAFSVYDPNMQQYEMFYCASTDSYPRNAAFMDINSGAWSFQSFPVYLTTGFASHERAGRSNAIIPLLFSSMGTPYRLNSDYTVDTPASSAISTSAYWEFMPFSGDGPAAQKTVTEVRVDYDSLSASSLSVRMSPSNGDTFNAGSRIALPATSVVSQGIAYPFESSRYPVVRIEQESQRQRIHRVHTTARIGGR